MKKYKKLFKGRWHGEVMEMTLMDWSRTTGYKYITLYSRMHKYGWSFQQCLDNKPLMYKNRRSKKITM